MLTYDLHLIIPLEDVGVSGEFVQGSRAGPCRIATPFHYQDHLISYFGAQDDPRISGPRCASQFVRDIHYSGWRLPPQFVHQNPRLLCPFKRAIQYYVRLNTA